MVIYDISVPGLVHTDYTAEQWQDITNTAREAALTRVKLIRSTRP